MHEWLSGGVSPCQGEGRGFESRLVLFCLQKKIKKSLKARDSLRPRRADAQVRMPSLRPLPWAALGQTLPSRAFFICKKIKRSRKHEKKNAFQRRSRFIGTSAVFVGPAGRMPRTCITAAFVI